MIVENKERESTIVGALQSTTASINATGQAINHMTSGLYSNKVKAIVRETLCNGIDAMFKANKGNQPVTFHQPTSHEPYYEVSDTGIGMSHDTVMTIYPVLFESTKQQSANEIGGFGLGAKAPLGYVDCFSLYCRYDGMLREYLISLDTSGLKVDLLVEEPTDDQNGTTVRVMVPPHDIDSWEDSIQEVIQFMDPMPVCKNLPLKVKRPEYVLSGKHWGFGRWNQLGADAPYAICGGVAYPIRIATLGNFLRNDHKEFLSRSTHLYLGINDVDILPTREELGYGEKTNQAIKTAISRAIQELKTTIFEEVQAEPTFYDACLLMEYYMHGRPGLDKILGHDFNKMTYRESERSLAQKKYSIKLPVEGITISRYGNSGRATKPQKLPYRGVHLLKDLQEKDDNGDLITKKAPTGEKMYQFDVTMLRNRETEFYLFDDVGRGSKRRINHNLMIGKISGPILIESTNKDYPVDRLIEMFDDLLGGPPIKRVSELVQAPRTEPNRKKTHRLFRLTEPFGTLTRRSWTGIDMDEVDLEGPCYTVMLKGHKLHPDYYPDTSVDLPDRIRMAKHFGLIEPDAEVYGIRPTGKKKAESEHTDIVRALELVVENHEIDLSEVADYVAIRNLPASKLKIFLRSEGEDWGEFIKTLPEESPLVAFYDAFIRISIPSVGDKARFMTAFGLKTDPSPRIRELYDATVDRYPLIDSIEGTYSDNLTKINDYIHVMEKVYRHD